MIGYLESKEKQMAKKREKKDLKKLEEDDEDELDVNRWIIKTIVTGCFLAGLVFLIEFFFEIPILTDTAVAIAVVLTIGFLHEGLHYREAVKLGYNPKWYRTVFTMGFEIHHDNTAEWEVHKKLIAHAPYKVVIPITFVILILGIMFSSLGLSIAAVGSFLLHVVSYTQEGKDV